jgi:hypothetical protein
MYAAALSQDRNGRDLDTPRERITKARHVEPRRLVGSFVARANRPSWPPRPTIYNRHLCTLHSAKEVELPDIAQIRSEAGQLLGPRFGDRIGERLRVSHRQLIIRNPQCNTGKAALARSRVQLHDSLAEIILAALRRPAENPIIPRRPIDVALLLRA